jgi:uncharacterized membrane protein
MNINDRVWLKFNKKIEGKTAVYFNDKVPWAIAGFWFGISLVMFIININSSWVIGLLFLIVSILYGYVCYRIDKTKGYMDAGYRQYLINRQDRLGKLTNKEN